MLGSKKLNRNQFPLYTYSMKLQNIHMRFSHLHVSGVVC